MNRISVLIDVTVDKANRALAGFRKSVSDADGAVGKLRAGAASVGASIKANIVPVAVAAGVAVAKFGRVAVDAASSLEESMNAVDVVFGESAESIHELGETSARSFGLSQSAFNGAAVSFASFAKVISGPGGDVAATIDDLMTRAVDFASVMDMDVGEAMNKFRSGLAGEAEPLRQFNIDVSAAAVTQYALSEGLVSSASEMTEAIKVQARYGLIMRQTTDHADDFANTADSLANQQRILDANMEDLAATVGEHLVPALASAAGSANDMLDVLDSLGLLDLAMTVRDATDPIQGFGRVVAVAKGETDLLGRSVVNLTDAEWDLIQAMKASGMSTGEAREAMALGLTTADQWLTARRYAAQAEANYSESVDITAAATDAAADSVENYGVSVEGSEFAARAAADAINAQRDAINSLHNATLAAIDSELGYRNQVADTIDTIIASTAAMDDDKLSTEERAQAARDAEGAVLDQASAAVKLADDMAESTGATLSAEEQTAVYRAELSRMAGYLQGPAREAVLGHIASIDAIPERADTLVNANTVTADGNIDRHKNKLLDLDGRVATTTLRSITENIVRNFQETGNAYGAGNTAGGWRPNRKTGGPVPGGKNDVVPINAHGGEYVLDAGTVDAIKKGQASAGKNTGGGAGSDGMSLTINYNGPNLSPADIARGFKLARLAQG